MYSVIAIQTNSAGKQWVLVDDAGKMANLPCRFLKHIITVGKSPYTQKSYAYALKFWSDFLALSGDVRYEDVSSRTFFSFLAWLQQPVDDDSGRTENRRQPRTVNTYISGVMSFYSYLYAMEYVDKDFGQTMLYTPSHAGANVVYKDFLYHTHKGEGLPASRLRVKEPRKSITILSPAQVKTVIEATNNIRDRFLIYLLFVSGLRIGEMLSLYNTDLIYDQKDGHRIRLTERGTLPNGGKLKTGERTIYINQTCMDLYDDYQYEMLDDLDKDSDFLFVKISGKNAGDPMTYDDVMSLFRRLKRKTGIDIHPHIFRHTHATMYYAKSKDAKALQDRLGHRDIQTTLNTYVHPTSEDVLKDWQQAAASFEMEGII